MSASTIAPEAGAQGLGLGGVEAGRRLVHADELGPGGQGPSRADQLALALRELVGHLPGQVPQVEHVERVLDTALVARPARVHQVGQEAPR